MIGHLVGMLHKRGSFKDKTTGDPVDYDKIECIILVTPKVGGKYEPIEAVGSTVVTIGNGKLIYFDPRDISSVFGKEYKNLLDVSDFVNEDIEYFCDDRKRICKISLLNN